METDNECVEIILLDKKPKESPQWTENEKNSGNVQVIELGVRSSTISKLQQFKFDSSRNHNLIENENQKTSNSGNLQQENKDFLKKLPSGTILLKHSNKNNSQQEVEDQQKFSTKEEININYSNVEGQTENRVQKGAKNKKIVEVRRNPTRLTKKILDKDFVTTRQKLLSAKRKDNFPNPESNKRIKLSNTVYMNTRSVTKKLDIIGSTSQVPSIYDLIEWKEWPVHGMHERPVFHLEHGLGTQYLGQFNKTLDTSADFHMSEESGTESEESDDHDENFLRLKKLIWQRIESLELQESEDTFENDVDIFETTMHSSLHLVLAYCAQVLSHEYQTVIQKKLKLLKSNATSDNQELPKTDFRNEFKLENADNKVSNSFPPNSFRSKNISSNTYRVLKFIAARMEPAKCLITPRKSANSVTNFQNNYSKLQDIIRGPSKNALILLKIQEPTRGNPKPIENPYPLTLHNNQFVKPSLTNLNWDDSAISGNSLMNMSSFYENLIPFEDMNFVTENFSRPCQDERAEFEMKNEDENKINEGAKNKNETLEVVKTLPECVKGICKGPETQNCDFQSEMINVRKNCHFSDQRKLGIIGSNVFHKPTEFIEEKNIQMKELQNKEETMEALDLSTVKSKTETVNKPIEEHITKDDLQILLENTIILYCIATGADQEDVADYIDTLNAKENIEWLKENCI